MSTDRRDSHGLEWKEVRQGAHPGDQFVRIARHRAFKKLGTGRYEVRASSTLPAGLGGVYTRLKRLVIGEPSRLASERASVNPQPNISRASGVAQCGIRRVWQAAQRPARSPRELAIEGEV